MDHKSVNDYLAHIKKRPAEHQGFMRAHRLFIARRKESPGMERFRDSKSLHNAKTVDTKKESGRTWENDWEFIEKDTWLDENRHLSQEAREQQAFVIASLEDGTEAEGVWVRPGKKGHHKCKDFFKHSVEMTKSIEDGSSVL